MEAVQGMGVAGQQPAALCDEQLEGKKVHDRQDQVGMNVGECPTTPQ